MGAIRSPLGAVGALMVFLEGIATSALIPLSSQPHLQALLVYLMVVSIGVITLVIVIVVAWFAFTNPGLLFNPQDIDRSVHLPLYGPSESPQSAVEIPHGAVIISPSNEEDEN